MRAKAISGGRAERILHTMYQKQKGLHFIQINISATTYLLLFLAVAVLEKQLVSGQMEEAQGVFMLLYEQQNGVIRKDFFRGLISFYEQIQIKFLSAFHLCRSAKLQVLTDIRSIDSTLKTAKWGNKEGFLLYLCSKSAKRTLFSLRNYVNKQVLSFDIATQCPNGGYFMGLYASLCEQQNVVKRREFYQRTNIFKSSFCNKSASFLHEHVNLI